MHNIYYTVAQDESFKLWWPLTYQDIAERERERIQCFLIKNEKKTWKVLQRLYFMNALLEFRDSKATLSYKNMMGYIFNQIWLVPW